MTPGSTRTDLLPRRFIAALALVLFSLLTVPACLAEDFAGFVARFEQKAVANGISPALYRSLTAGLTPDPLVPDLITGQPEFTTPIWEYLDTRVSDRRIAQGRTAYAANEPLFERTGGTYGVDPHLLAAIWGIETNYGTVLTNSTYIRPVIRSLFTVCAQHRGRWQEDEAELIAAFRLIQDRGWTDETLVGSWAGAIGHTQLIVSALLKYGTDGDGDKRIDPQASLADALATSAVYLNGLGYQAGLDWGYEVTVPDGFDLLLATRETLRPIGFFAERGVKRVAGRVFTDPDQPVFLYLPAGVAGPVFLMTGNYLVLKSYNFSDAYALAVAHLTDRLKGSGPFVATWPRTTRLPNLSQRIAVQEALKRLGYYHGVIDGRIGPITQRAYALFQAKNGLPADGFVTAESAAILESVAP